MICFLVGGVDVEGFFLFIWLLFKMVGLIDCFIYWFLRLDRKLVKSVGKLLNFKERRFKMIIFKWGILFLKVNKKKK